MCIATALFFLGLGEVLWGLLYLGVELDAIPYPNPASVFWLASYPLFMAGIQVGTLGLRIGGVPRDLALSHADLRAAVASARRQGSTLLDKDDSVMIRLPLSGEVGLLLVDERYDALNPGSVSRAETRARARAWEYVTALRTMPDWENAYLAQSGPLLGTRESRHVNARYRLSADEVTRAARHDDAVARGSWAMEYHDRAGGASTWLPVADRGTYDIPLRCLMSEDTPNLYAAGRLADGDRLAGGSLRVMGHGAGHGSCRRRRRRGARALRWPAPRRRCSRRAAETGRPPALTRAQVVDDESGEWQWQVRKQRSSPSCCDRPRRWRSCLSRSNARRASTRRT